MPADTPGLGRVLIPSSLDVPGPVDRECFESLVAWYADRRCDEIERGGKIPEDIAEALLSIFEVLAKRGELQPFRAPGGMIYEACANVARTKNYHDLAHMKARGRWA